MNSDVVVFGAGKLGRKIARAVAPVLFCDNNQQNWGTYIDGIPVASLPEAVLRYPEAIFIVAIWNPSRTECMLDRVAQLRAVGARKIQPFADLLRDRPETLLPHFFWERPEYYRDFSDQIGAARLLFDDKGREEFDRQIRLRSGDYSSQVIDPGAQYFPWDFFELTDHEVFVDCGAYDGDTIRQFQSEVGDQFDKILAFEPDPSNFAKLGASFGSDPRIQLRPFATGARREFVSFASEGTSSHLSSQGDLQIEVVALDEVLRGESPTYMKFDIEGSEPDTLEGAREVITRSRPKLAVCVYHLPDHLWSIPLQLKRLLPDARITLRTYNADGLECVCYADSVS